MAFDAPDVRERAKRSGSFQEHDVTSVATRAEVQRDTKFVVRGVPHQRSFCREGKTRRINDIVSGLNCLNLVGRMMEQT